ncbi:hypothetical protein [Sinorhizobium sp. CCBAU 05631]|uniref:hypothetical protein n=1 Tax=Sinorhizobium sp. CCBAU 05631 TaxID=794846 RepID=UPI0004AD6791|nr:hypothetical protein [Sinorhizobium sp. CCBAU 05631]ASY56461.1 hypothetical protein SS05631_c15250 [Sinorhizobium sp. CCBAU 05631]
MQQANAKDERQFNVDRRSLLVGVFASTAMPKAAACEPEPDPLAEVERCAAALAESLKVAHGGTWSVQISHETGFVAVSRDFA